MKLAIVGSRSFNDYQYLCDLLSSYKEPIDLIISGGATGADTLAERYAKENNIPFKCFPANWTKYGKRAGYVRNAEIVKESDKVIAFWDGISKGTKHTMSLAKRDNKPLKEVLFNSRP